MQQCCGNITYMSGNPIALRGSPRLPRRAKRSTRFQRRSRYLFDTPWVALLRSRPRIWMRGFPRAGGWRRPCESARVVRTGAVGRTIERLGAWRAGPGRPALGNGEPAAESGSSQKPLCCSMQTALDECHSCHGFTVGRRASWRRGWIKAEAVRLLSAKGGWRMRSRPRIPAKFRWRGTEGSGWIKP